MHTPPTHLVLASASPARLRLLQAAGLDPQVIVSGVDEDVPDGAGAAEAVELLAARKARHVAADVDDALVLGCDSLFELDGRVVGKPGTAAVALERARAMRGRSGHLLTGHCLIDTRGDRERQAVAATTVHLGRPSDDELAAYIATGEPLEVAGGFTLDGRSAPFIEGIEGDPGTVIGVSLPTLRRLLAELDVAISDLWV